MRFYYKALLKTTMTNQITITNQKHCAAKSNYVNAN